MTPRSRGLVRGCSGGLDACGAHPGGGIRLRRTGLRKPVIEIGHDHYLAVNRTADDLGHGLGDEVAEAGVDPILGELRRDPDRIDAVGEA
jgi:hypothetical protein